MKYTTFFLYNYTFYHQQIPATPLPREIHFKSDREEIEAFVSREAQDEDLKTTLSETSVDFKSPNNSTSNENGVFDNCLGESSSSYSNLIQTSSQSELSDASSPKAKRSPLDLSPENFFMTSNEINGKFLIYCALIPLIIKFTFHLNHTSLITHKNLFIKKIIKLKSINV